MPFHRHAITA